MIKIELEITTRTINNEAMELLRLELRRRALQFVFESVDAVSAANDMRFSHRDIHVAGDIQLLSAESKS